MLDKYEIARALREIGALLTAKGENPFKVRAYDNGAKALERMDEDLGLVVDEGRLTAYEWIGEALAVKITELWRDGRSAYLDKLRAEVPPGLVELLRLPDLGPKRVQALRDAGIESVADLERAARAGQLRAVKGFSPKVEAKVLANLEARGAKTGRVRLGDALELSERLGRFLEDHPAVERAQVAGAVRRRHEVADAIDVVVATTDPDAVAAHLARFPQELPVEVRLRPVAPEDWFVGLHHHTGSEAHVARLRSRAHARGLTLSEWGLLSLKGAGKLTIGSEDDIYRHLELPLVPPELREDEGEIELAESGETWADLIDRDDVQGIVHAHTTFSDGRDTIEAMARAAEALGMKYLTITDHSPTAFYANGVDVDRMKAQWDEIDRVQELVSVRLLKGTESDILRDGGLDYPDEVLEQLDVVIASVHSRYKLDEDAMTRRLVQAMRHPLFKIWGHALGRLLEERPPIACRVEEVLDALAESRGAVEINGDPKRLDLEPRWVREARKRGIPIVISADAHSVAGYRATWLGVDMARRAGVRRGEVLNALPADRFAAAVRPAG